MLGYSFSNLSLSLSVCVSVFPEVVHRDKVASTHQVVAQDWGFHWDEGHVRRMPLKYASGWGGWSSGAGSGVHTTPNKRC